MTSGEKDDVSADVETLETASIEGGKIDLGVLGSFTFPEGASAKALASLPLVDLLDVCLAATALFALMGYTEVITYIGPIPGAEIAVGVVVIDGDRKNMQGLGAPTDLTADNAESARALWHARVERYNALGQEERRAFFEASRVRRATVDIVMSMIAIGFLPKPGSSVATGMRNWVQPPPDGGAKA